VIQVDADTRLDEAVFCSLDFETTGINPVVDRVVEVGMVKFTMAEELSAYSTLVNPGRDIPENVVMIHGITGDMVKNSPAMGDLLEDIAAFIGDSPLIIQNPRFDLAFLGVAFIESNAAVPPLRAYDTVRLARKTFMGLPNYRLETLCRSLDIALKPHRALSDARGCMEVFRNVIRFHDRNGEWDFNDLNRLHGSMMKPRLSRKEKQHLYLSKKIFSGVVVQIRYVDERGNVTVRRVLPKQVIKNGTKTYLHAFCYMRNEDRFFNTRRIRIVN